MMSACMWWKRAVCCPQEFRERSDLARLALPSQALHVPTHDRHGCLQRIRGTELDGLGARGAQRDVSWGAVIRVTGGVGLVVIGVAKHELAAQHDAPMRALA